MRRWFVVLLALLAACGGHAKVASRDIGRAKPPLRSSTPPPVRIDEAAPASVPSHLIASVGDKTVGPFVARRGSVVMAAYIGTTVSGVRRVVSVPLGEDGTPKEAKVIAPTPADANTLVLRASGGDRARFVAAWTALTDRGEALSVAGVGDDGAPLGEAIEIARTNDDIVWIDVVPTARGAVCVWAEETRAGDANVLAVALDPDGKPRGVPSRVAKGVSGWQALALPSGVGLALASRVPAAQGDGAAPNVAAKGALSWMKLDTEARAVAAPSSVALTPAPILDVDVARVGGGVVFAWTDRASADPAVIVAAIDSDGKWVAPHPVTERSGGASLVALTGGEAGGLVAWDEAIHRGRGARRIHLAKIDARGVADAAGAVVLETEGRAAPEVAPTDGGGFALLAQVRACAESPGPTDPPCAEAPAFPALVRLDEKLGVVATEPMRLGDTHESASLAWGLSCAKDRCLALTATGDSPVRVRAVDLLPRASRYRAPVAQPLPADSPRVTALSTLASGDAIAEVAAAHVGDVTLVATITAALDEPTKKGEVAGASISVRAVDATGQIKGAPVTITKRALSIGGVSIASGAGPDDGAAIAWVARDNGDPEVHVTSVDKRGRRTKDVQLTTTKGDASDVSIAWVGGGWLVAWVDGRDGNGEVYATKVAPDLRRIAREERITNALGDASDVTLFAPPGKSGRAWVAWADPRESPHDGFADVFVAPLHTLDAKLDGAEARVLATAAHSRSPALASASDGEGVTVAWIEEAPMGVDVNNTGQYGAMIAALDAKGHPRSEPVRTRGAGDGFPTSIALERSASVLRAVVARSGRDDVFLDALEWDGASPPRAFAIMSLDGPPSLDVSLTLLGDALYFNDDGPDTDAGRARRATVAWKR